MKFLPVLFFSATALAAPGQHRGSTACGTNDVRDLSVTRQGASLLLDGKPWKAVGPNVYWLGLDENVIPPAGEPFYAPTNASYPTKSRITEIMAIVKAMGGTMIRAHTLGVSTGNPLSLWPTLGKTNEQAFDPIDWAVYQAREYGIRLMIPLTDNFDYYHGGKYDFLRWNGFNLSRAVDEKNPEVQQFYNNATVVASFKDYIKTLLTHVNKYTNLTYAEDPTIFAYETGNELCGPIWGDMDVPAAWISDIGKYIKGLAPKKLFVDGTYGVNASHLSIPEVDILSDHYYPPLLGKLEADLKLVETVNKTYFAGEYDWVGKPIGNKSGGDSLADFFKVLEQSPVAGGDMFWSLFGHAAPDCTKFVTHNDEFTLAYGNPENSAYTTSRIQLIRKHFVKMSQGVDISANETLPSVPCPAPTHVEKGTRR